MEGGQSAFAAIQEIVAQLMADPTTDWSRVDIEALRQHLIDMDNVTLTSSIRAMVPAHAATMDGVEGWTMQAAEIPGGAISPRPRPRSRGGRRRPLRGDFGGRSSCPVASAR